MGTRKGLARITALSGYQLVADRLGLDTRPLLKAAGLTPGLLAEPERFVPAAPLGDLLEESARRSGCATFGLQMALERTPSDMGMISVLIALQPNLDSLFCAIGRYRNAILPILATTVERHDNRIAVVRADLALPSNRPYRQGNDLLLGALMGLARGILGDDWHPECTCFAYPEPCPSDRLVYQRVFGSDLQFNADFNGFVITLEDLVRPRAGADPGLADHAASLVRRSLNPEEPDLIQRAREAIIYLLGSSRASLEDAASMLGVHSRTLQRRLEKEGVTFRDLVNRARVQLAARHLANPNLSIAEVAETLGYSSSGAFSRWYRHEFGRSPREGRASSAGA